MVSCPDLEPERLLRGLWGLFQSAGTISRVATRPAVYWCSDTPRGISYTEHRLSILDAIHSYSIAETCYEIPGDASAEPLPTDTDLRRLDWDHPARALARSRDRLQQLHHPTSVLWMGADISSQIFETLPQYVRTPRGKSSGAMLRLSGRVSGRWDLVQDATLKDSWVRMISFSRHEVAATCVPLLIQSRDKLRDMYQLGITTHIPSHGHIDALHATDLGINNTPWWYWGWRSRQGGLPA